jgi:hypothetical protein
MQLQGRYVTSRSEIVNFKTLSAALKEDFPNLPIEDAAAHPDADNIVLDNSKVGSFSLGLMRKADSDRPTYQGAFT